MDAGIDQRPAANSASNHRAEAREEAQIEESRRTPVPRVTPQEPVDGRRVTWKVRRRVPSTTLEHHHCVPGLGQSQGADRAAKAGTDDDGLDLRVHTPKRSKC